ncbi:RidA family protein [Aeromicrobium sp. 636]|uniref:RidA family protein n=1 Tax=Aeromicrobium senzhongii TaxID=2663859 RepID=A0A8I0EX94_9ACTN|nr:MULTISPECIES: RidA family protein [Aeromicrobium]MBC9227051.1 RidA family protein [Aeromicrobium senzhongii]MCQ3999151.1 RidA family protein [Aeromicrobium sp. 636]MTB89348.1 RidA family protein [Aeromicrobium senzhongii]QNL94499.1 RidA family protein [Aeromicrobium senzhongii]
MGAVVERLASMGLTVPDVAAPVASYVPALRSGSHVFTSGQLPFVDGALPAVGKVGAEVSPEDAHEYARLCGLNVIAAINSIADLDTVVRVVKVTVFVASAPDFTGQPGVANGASDLLAAAFGAAGSHTRSAVGVAVLPLNSPVEVDAIVEVA